MVQPDKKLLWHPTRSNRFVVGGGHPIGQIKVYDWDGKSEITEVTALGDLQHMKCFALSPHPHDDDLVAVGNSLGKVELMRFSAPHPPNTVRSPAVVTLPVRTSRTCNALAFSQVDPNYLAVGLDKVRGDPSLVIWDIETVSAGLHRSSDSSSGYFVRPQNLLPRSVRGDKSTLQQWAHTEVVTSLSFLPHAANLLVAGVSHRWLRLFDLRTSNSPTNPLSTATKSVYGISVDPFDSNRLACFGDDGAVRVWDTRRFGTPLLTFTERDAIADGANPRTTNAIGGIEFSSARRGTLATMEKDALSVRFWDTLKATFSEDREASSIRSEPIAEEFPTSKISKLARLPWASSLTDPPTTSSDKQPMRGEQVVLFNTRTSKRFTRPISSFAFIPSSNGPSNKYSIGVVTKDGDLDMQTMVDSPQLKWSSRGELSLAVGQSFEVYQPFHQDGAIAEPWTVVPPERSLPRSRVPTPHSQSRGRPDLAHDRPLDPLPPSIGLESHSSSPMRRLNSDKFSAPDATPRPGQFALRPENDSTERIGRMHQKTDARTDLRSLSRGKLSSNERASRRVITDDISMVIRKRALKGYGLENLLHNASVARLAPGHGEVLSELWRWIENSHNLLSSGPARIHGFDFANQGVLGIWEGLQPLPRTPSLERDPVIEQQQSHDVELSLLSLPDDDGDGYRTPGRQRTKRQSRRTHSPADQLHGDFAAAVHTLNTRRGYDRASVAKIPAHTSKLPQRRFCLTLCGWNHGDDELLRNAARWEKDGNYTKAACWLLFTDHPDKAVDCLMRSNDERLRIMSGTVAALIPQRGNSAHNPQLREHYNRLIVRIEDPYLRSLLTHIALEDWSEILQEEFLPLQERLAIAFRFLDDRALSSYLRQLLDRFRGQGAIEGIILTGLTPTGVDLLQGYIDSTGDVQTASILAAFIKPGSLKDTRVDQWLEAYRSLLDGWRLFNYRCQFDIERGKLIKNAISMGDVPAFDWVPPQLVVRCGFCNKAINARAPMVGGSGSRGRMRVNCCQNCGRSLPRCAICLATLGLLFDLARNTELADGLGPTDSIDDAIVFCQKCKHGGHVSHMLEWFHGSESEGHSHDECAVAGCNCRCALE